MSIGERLEVTLKRAGISPRILGAITRVHFTTIYKLMAKPTQPTYPLVDKTLSDTLDKLDELIHKQTLPFREVISDKEKTDRLAMLLATND